MRRVPTILLGGAVLFVGTAFLIRGEGVDGKAGEGLTFSSYFGSGPAVCRTVSIDREGNIYVAGGTNRADWPTTPGAFQRTHRQNGWPDVTAAKFTPDGKLVWSTLIGGPFEDYAYVSAVNDEGELYLAGRAGDGFPTTDGAFDRSFNGGARQGPHSATDGFVLKLSADGGRLLYSTYIGGSANDNTRAIHLLPTGELIVAGGNTKSRDLPVTPGVLKPRLSGKKDAWVAKVAADGKSLPFLTYFGPGDEGRLDETIRGVGTDADGNIWLGGTTGGTDLRPTPDAFQKRRGKKSEGYIAKLSPDGAKLVYFSWLGGLGEDEIETEGVSDAAGAFYVAGSTASPDFPFTPGAFRRRVEGLGGAFEGDGYVAKINPDGSLAFATSYGGSTRGPEACFGPAVDGEGRVYVTGRMRSPDCPLTPDAAQPGKNGDMDAVLAVFDPTGRRLLYGTFLGGSGVEHGRHIAVHPDGKFVVIVGETSSRDFPQKGPRRRSPSGAFLARFDLEDLPSFSGGR